MVEQRPFKALVASSSLARPTVPPFGDFATVVAPSLPYAFPHLHSLGKGRVSGEFLDLPRQLAEIVGQLVISLRLVREAVRVKLATGSLRAAITSRASDAAR